MRAPEDLHGTRVVAAPAALDAMPVPDEGVISGGVTMVRLAADDLLILHRGSFLAAWAGETTILEPETGFAGWWLAPDELERVRHHVDWPLVAGLNQGLVAGVPARVWLGPDRSLLLVARAYAHELEARL